MKVLSLPRYGRTGASSRLRTYQYDAMLREAGVEMTHFPLLDDSYLERLYASGTRTVAARILAYSRRVLRLLSSGRYDLIWLEKELLPWAPAWLEEAMLTSHVPLLIDFDDAVHHNYDQAEPRLVKRLLATKIPRLMRRAAAVTVGSQYLFEFAAAAGARSITLLPTSVDLIRYTPVGTTRRERRDELVVGWIGTPLTSRNLQLVRAPLSVLAQQVRFSLRVIGAVDLDLPGVSVEHVPWSENTEVESLAGIDVGVMPLFDTPFNRGKCAYKLIQYMALGKPVVASPVGENARLVRHGENGLLAATSKEWHEHLSSLLRNAGLRSRLGRSGRATIVAGYSMRDTGQRIIELLNSLAR